MSRLLDSRASRGANMLTNVLLDSYWPNRPLYLRRGKKAPFKLLLYSIGGKHSVLETLNRLLMSHQCVFISSPMFMYADKLCSVATNYTVGLCRSSVSFLI